MVKTENNKNDIISSLDSPIDFNEDSDLDNITEIISEYIALDLSNLNIGKTFFYKKLHNKKQTEYIIKEYDIKEKEMPKSDSWFFVVSSNKEFKTILWFNKWDVLVEKDHSYIYFDGNKMVYCNKNWKIIWTDKDYRQK